jgi:hypothetical protein
MPLNADQRRRLTKALTEAFPTEAALAQMVYFADLTPPRTLQAITTASGIDALVRELMTRADGEGWLPKLVDEAAKQNPHQGLAEFRDEIKPLILAAAANHYRVLLMGDRPLIDRENLREAVERLATGKKRILVIDGDPVSGKSHTIWFIRHLHDHHRNFGLVWIDLRELAKAAKQGVIEPVEIARSMALQMGIPDVISAREEETWAAWINGFCDRLTGRLATADRPWWLVMDSFAAVALPQDSLGLVKTLCERLVINIPNLNLILLSYKDSIPDTVEPDVHRETIERIDAPQVGLFFKALYESRQVDASEQLIARKLAEVLRAVDPKHPRRLEALAAEVRRIAKQILEEPIQP